MKFKLKIGEKNYEIEISENENETLIKVDDKEFLFEKEKKLKVPVSSFPKKDFSSQVVLAPISGTITEIFIKEGDFVEKEQKLLTLLAMKMENEIRAIKEGRVKKIFVKKGDIVKKDQKLLEIL